MNRFLLCTRETPLDGDPGTPADSVDRDGFVSKEYALQMASVLPGKGYGYVYDAIEQRVVHLFAWKRGAPAN